MSGSNTSVKQSDRVFKSLLAPDPYALEPSLTAGLRLNIAFARSGAQIWNARMRTVRNSMK